MPIHVCHRPLPLRVVSSSSFDDGNRTHPRRSRHCGDAARTCALLLLQGGWFCGGGAGPDAEPEDRAAADIAPNAPAVRPESEGSGSAVTTPNGRAHRSLRSVRSSVAAVAVVCQPRTAAPAIVIVVVVVGCVADRSPHREASSPPPPPVPSPSSMRARFRSGFFASPMPSQKVG